MKIDEGYEIDPYDREGNRLVDEWAGKAAKKVQVPATKKSNNDLVDGMVWNIQNRIMAIVRNYTEHHKKEDA